MAGSKDTKKHTSPILHTERLVELPSDSKEGDHEGDLTEQPQTSKTLKRVNTKRRRRKPATLAKVLIELRNHFISTITLTGLGVALNYILKGTLSDPKFFDIIPIRHVFDAGDIAVIATFFIIMIRKLLKM